MTKRSKMVIYPQMARRLKTVGKQIKLARKRRHLTAQLVAERAGVSRSSVCAVERGDPSVSFGIYANVLAAIGLPDDILLLAKDDELGRALMDAELLNPSERKVHKRG